MRRFVLQRLGLAVLVLWGLITLVFLMIQLIPGDPARTAAGRTATAEQVEQVRERLGLDEPIPVQYARYLGRLVEGDLGTSVFTFRPIADDLMAVLPSSLELVLLAMIINISIALPLAIIAALRRGKWPDVTARLVALFGAAVPVFWLALMLQFFLGAKLRVLPLAGQLTSGLTIPHRTGMLSVDALLAGDLIAFADVLAHLLLPACVLAAPFIAVVTRTLRSSLVGVLDSDYITIVHAKGASTARIVARHALRNALPATNTIVGMQLGWMLGSTVLIEAIFGRRGIGSYATTAVLQNDVFAVVAVVLVIGVVFVIANLTVDLFQLVLDPRLRTPRKV